MYVSNVSKKIHLGILMDMIFVTLHISIIPQRGKVTLFTFLAGWVLIANVNFYNKPELLDGFMPWADTLPEFCYAKKTNKEA